MNSIETVAEYFKENAKPLAGELVKEIVDKFDFPVLPQEIDQAKEVYFEFLGFLGRSIIADENETPEGLIEWSRRNGEQEALLKGKISGIIMRYPATRQVFIERFASISMDHGLSAREILTINKRINYVLDISIYETILAFERFTDKVIKRAQDEVNELSAPIVPIQAGIAVLPLIGTFGFDRAQALIEKAVGRVAKLGVECIIIDFSGLVMIDDEVASQIFNIHNIFRLLGIKVIITGLRPELAQTVVAQGIDFSHIDTYANVKQAIESLD
ncbi:STAS domain-containing protein [Peribacillus glennii]|uniref:STAS domain-containing protein n=1 Tax=Peribacillus glennii TaxID=2303991 RepID=A0A372LIK7_9BACI|nr:STAS domain-containing protein [Peribacillus glennii]RFU66229.1 STAS domain-containing protein [Peribacillus glennii]